jgi:hypothetical protein
MAMPLSERRPTTVFNRRTLLSAGALTGAGLVLSDLQHAAPARAASSTVWSVQTVAVIGADAIVAAGTDALRTSITSLGFIPDNVYIDAVRGRLLGRRDSTGRSIQDAVAAARDYFGGDPDVWVLDLYSPDSDSLVASQVREALAGTAKNGDRVVLWIGQSQQGALNSSQVRFNAVAAPIVNAHNRGRFTDLDAYLRGQTGTLWAGQNVMTAYGYTRRTKFLYYMVGPAKVGSDGGWTKAKLLTPPPRSGSSIIDPSSGRRWDTVRYEDLYRLGDSLQQTLNRCTGGRVVTFPAGVFEFSGFTQGWYDGIRIGSGGASGCRGIAGSGRSTIFQMKAGTGSMPNSSSRRLISVDLVRQGAAYFGNFQLRGTDQPLDRWAGLNVDNSPGSVVEWIYCNGASRGYMNRPPGETMAIMVNRSDSTTVRDCEVDARHPVTRARWGSSPIGWNGSWDGYARNAKVERSYVHHSLAGMTTFWLTDGVTMNNFHSFSCGSGTGERSGSQINLEEVTGSVRLTYPRLFANGDWYRQTQWPADPTATQNNGFAFGQACTTTSQSDLICLEPRFDLNVNGLMTTCAYTNYTSTAGVKNKIVTPPVIIKNGRSLVGHDHKTSGWQSRATPDTDFTWVR